MRFRRYPCGNKLNRLFLSVFKYIPVRYHRYVRHWIKSQLLYTGCTCVVGVDSKNDGFVSVGSLLALFGLLDYRACPEFCVCEPWGSLFLFCFLLLHPRGCRTTDSTRTKHLRYSTVCQSTKPFDCVSTLADVVAPTSLLRAGAIPKVRLLRSGPSGPAWWPDSAHCVWW